MSKMTVIYWSQTGNTEAMAKAIAQGAEAAGAEVKLLTVSEASEADVTGSDLVAFGCPAMGAEVLEEDEFEPFFTGVEGKLSGKKVALFGSYGWGDGQWMRDWWDRAERDGAVLYGGEGLMVNETPDDEGLERCRAFGGGFAGAEGKEARGMGMSSAATRYLLTIYRLSGEGAPVRSVDISRALGVSPASVVHMMGVLTAEGFITKRHYGRVQLTGEGIWAANQLHTKCMLLESFLAEELAVAEEVAHRDAVACLCSLSEESIERIVRRVLPGNAVMLRAVGE